MQNWLVPIVISVFSNSNGFVKQLNSKTRVALCHSFFALKWLCLVQNKIKKFKKY